jgi:hypothetical protein
MIGLSPASLLVVVLNTNRLKQFSKLQSVFNYMERITTLTMSDLTNPIKKTARLIQFEILRIRAS